MIYLTIADTEEQWMLCNGTYFLDFINWCASRGSCPNLIRFTPGATALSSKKDKPNEDWSEVSLSLLKQEIAALLLEEGKLPDFVKYIASIYKEAIDRSDALGKNLIMD